MDGILDYEFLRSLGQGNHGEFFLASRPARLPVEAPVVAVKVIDASVSDKAYARAMKELRAFAAVRSPYLPTLFDAGQDGGRFFYAMEYFPSGSLGSPARPLGRAEVLRAVAHAARAAHDLHEAGILHRDIKPGNVMIHDGGAKLCDLGLAQFLTPGLTVTGLARDVRSVEFIDPAVLRGERTYRAADIWSLGATMHRALSGRGVYGELDQEDLLVAVRKVQGAAPQIDGSLEPGEAAIVKACLARDPADRPGTAREVADQVERLHAMKV